MQLLSCVLACSSGVLANAYHMMRGKSVFLPYGKILALKRLMKGETDCDMPLILAPVKMACKAMGRPNWVV